jgi:hypothetical protein
MKLRTPPLIATLVAAVTVMVTALPVVEDVIESRPM